MLARQDILIAPLQYSRVLVLCLLALITGCTQQKSSVSSNPSGTSGWQLPFDRTPEGVGVPATAELTPEVPVGTAIVIRLQSPLSSVSAHSGDPFQALLDQPILLDNRTVLPSGIVVRGRVLAAKPGELQEPGYLRLTLSSILVDNRTLDVHTSSLFAKAGLHRLDETAANHPSHVILADVAASNSNESNHAQRDVKFSTVRRLTFRLVRPLSLPSWDSSRNGTS
jgi:hypothetical protein